MSEIDSDTEEVTELDKQRRRNYSDIPICPSIGEQSEVEHKDSDCIRNRDYSRDAFYKGIAEKIDCTHKDEKKFKYTEEELEKLTLCREPCLISNNCNTYRPKKGSVASITGGWCIKGQCSSRKKKYKKQLFRKIVLHHESYLKHFKETVSGKRFIFKKHLHRICICLRHFELTDIRDFWKNGYMCRQAILQQLDQTLDIKPKSDRHKEAWFRTDYSATALKSKWLLAIPEVPTVDFSYICSDCTGKEAEFCLNCKAYFGKEEGEEELLNFLPPMPDHVTEDNVLSLLPPLEQTEPEKEVFNFLPKLPEDLPENPEDVPMDMDDFYTPVITLTGENNGPSLDFNIFLAHLHDILSFYKMVGLLQFDQWTHTEDLDKIVDKRKQNIRKANFILVPFRFDSSPSQSNLAFGLIFWYPKQKHFLYLAPTVTDFNTLKLELANYKHQLNYIANKCGLSYIEKYMPIKTSWACDELNSSYFLVGFLKLFCSGKKPNSNFEMTDFVREKNLILEELPEMIDYVREKNLSLEDFQI